MVRRWGLRGGRRTESKLAMGLGITWMVRGRLAFLRCAAEICPEEECVPECVQ